MQLVEPRKRVVISGVSPEVAAGRFPVKRAVGETVRVKADIFIDSHDEISAILFYRSQKNSRWSPVPMRLISNDRWAGAFTVEELGIYQYILQAWADRFKTWQRDIGKKLAAGQDVSIDFLSGAELLGEASSRAGGPDAEQLYRWAENLKSDADPDEKALLLKSPKLSRLMSKYPDRRFAATNGKQLEVIVERKRARFSAWYEMFPRSCGPVQGNHGTFDDCIDRLPYIAEMGFDVLYFPPIHPIGRTQRKGKNNATGAGPDDPGSPWAIGAEEGGHKAIHPQLGTLDDFRRLIAGAHEFHIEIAIDIAFQCSPDHPYVSEHPEWFRLRPDGTIQYAENPPKKYEDIYPFDFETEKWQDLFQELISVVRFWVDLGIRIFRVDNPHTKPFSLWEQLIGEIKGDCPEAIFLAEAFTRPKIMHRLANVGFTQSYTYFAWRNTKTEITQYFTELTQTDIREFFWPNLWPNTPDILTEYLQSGGRPAFVIRLVLAATLGASYGIYGPAFELCENTPKEPGSEEYLDSEKYQLRHWDIDSPDSLKHIIARVNRIRRENPALQHDWRLNFHPINNEQLICYSKHTEDAANIVLIAVNLDPHHTHSGWVELSLEKMGLDPGLPFQVHDLLSDARYLWQGSRNYIELNPRAAPAHIFRIRRRIRTERDFDYFL